MVPAARPDQSRTAGNNVLLCTEVVTWQSPLGGTAGPKCPAPTRGGNRQATGRKKKRQAPPNVAPFQVKQIKRLLRHRDYPWPNDRQSRRYLQPLLDIGLTGHEAKKLAPWLSGDELEEMIMQTVVAPKWNARTLGDRYEVTLEEKLIPRLGLKNLECFDAQRWQYQEELAERRRERNAIQKRRDRGSAKEKNQTMTQTADVVILRRMPCGTPSNMRDRVVSSHQRQQLLYNWMTGKGWFAIPDLAKVSTLRRDIPVYDKHGDRTIERTLHRDADELIRLASLSSARSFCLTVRRAAKYDRP